MKVRLNLQKITILLSMVFAIFIMPVSILSLGYQYYLKTSMQLEKSQLLSFAETVSQSLGKSVHNSRFWCLQFNSAFYSSHSSKQLMAKIEKLSKRHEQKLACMIWGPGESQLSNVTMKEFTKQDWRKIGKILYESSKNPGDRLSLTQDIFLKKTIGPHLESQKFSATRQMLLPRLIESDLNLVNPLFWSNINGSYTAMILLPTSVLNKRQGMKEVFATYRQNLQDFEFCILDKNNKLLSNSAKSVKELRLLQTEFRTSENKLKYKNGQLIFAEQLPGGFFFLLSKKVSQTQSSRFTLLFALSLAFFYLLLFRTFSLEKMSSELKVKRAIYLFIGCSNILPLIILAFFTQQYLTQKHLVMIDEKKTEAIKFIHMIEQEFTNEVERFPQKTTSIIEAFKQKLKQKPINHQDSQQFTKKLVDSFIDFHLIASTTLPILSNRGFMDKKSFTPNAKFAQGDEDNKRLLELVSKIGSAFLSFWNKTQISQKALTEMELVSDFVFQKSIEESLFMLVEINDQLGFFGFGTETDPSFTHIISLQNPEIGDYLGIFQYNPTQSAIDFLYAKKRYRLANAYGLKVIFSRAEILIPDMIEPFKASKELQQVFLHLKNYPPITAETAVLDGQKWVYTGYRNSIIPDVEIVAFYPLAEIEQRLRSEANDLIFLFLLNLTIVFAVSFFFSHLLLLPITLLGKGTRAIGSKDFAYRLPEMGNDEFGRMGKIFNEAISDLEELSIARVVQQQLFPTEKIDTGKFDLHGKTITLADLGGDYLDYFSVDEDSFAVILGDVAGHGVGAAMIMAMAKSATINSSDLFKAPVKLVERLHKLIYSTKTKRQKKIMTFQYLFVNKEQSKISYSNAGGCNPFMVNRPLKKVEEIVLPGAALGAFKKGKFKETEIQFVPGDVMVLYSDGIVEARNESGEEIGYPGFKELLLRNWSPSPEQFYHDVVNEYYQWLGNEPPQDDLTLIFLGFPRA